MSKKKNYYIECPYCKEEYNYSSDLVGEKLVCMECKKEFIATVTKESPVLYGIKRLFLWIKWIIIIALILFLVRILWIIIAVNMK